MLKGREWIRGEDRQGDIFLTFESGCGGWPHLFRKNLEKAEFLKGREGIRGEDQQGEIFPTFESGCGAWSHPFCKTFKKGWIFSMVAKVFQ